MLPKKTFLKREFILTESDFDVTGYAKPQKIMEIMQDLATDHADIMGFGWDEMDKHGLFWVLSKVRMVFNKPVTRHSNSFTLYTWPLAANKLFIERRYVAVDDKGCEIFAASTIWLMVERDTRKIADSKTISEFYKADFDNTPCISCAVERIRKTDEYSHAFDLQIRRSELDINKHVNNTRYVTYAADVLDQAEKITQIEITYHKELKLGDKVFVYSKRAGNSVSVVGERNGEMSFTVRLVLE